MKNLQKALKNLKEEQVHAIAEYIKAFELKNEDSSDDVDVEEFEKDVNQLFDELFELKQS